MGERQRWVIFGGELTINGPWAMSPCLGGEAWRHNEPLGYSIYPNYCVYESREAAERALRPMLAKRIKKLRAELQLAESKCSAAEDGR